MLYIMFHIESTKHPVASRENVENQFLPATAYHFTPPQHAEDKSKQVGQAERR